jgi:3-methyladenine DNA glycosylase/8-oxoguanine DNA glycosylase
MLANRYTTNYNLNLEHHQHLAEIIKHIGSYSIQIRNDSYLSLVEVVIYQQLTGKAASTIYNRFLEHYKGSIPKPEQILSSSEIELRAKVGLSRMKIAYLKDLAAHIIDAMFKIANIPCRIIEFCELSLAYSPSSVTNTLDEFTNDDALVSIVVFRA